MQRVMVCDLCEGRKIFQGNFPEELWNGLFLHFNIL